jgi:A/G-specific adenine glycosylase
VKRVLTRIFLGDGRREKDVWALATDIVPRNGKRAWMFNQALMELGALVCKPRKPLCPACPVNTTCRSFST